MLYHMLVRDVRYELLSYHILTKLGFDKHKMRDKAIEKEKICDTNFYIMSQMHRVGK